MWKELWIILKTRRIKTTITKPVIIYGIRLLNRKSYIYCGQTVQGIEARIYTHITESMKGTHKNKELQKKMIKCKFLVTFDILETTTVERANVRESFWIHKLLKEKHPLTNIREPLKSFTKIKGNKNA